MPSTTPVSSPSMHPRQAPGSRGLPLLGSIVDLARHGAIDVFTQHWQTHGDIFQLYVGRQRWVVVVDPDAAYHVMVAERQRYIKGETYDQLRLLTGNGLITAEGALWKQRRRLANAIFTRDSVHKQVPRMLGAIDGRLDDVLSGGPTADIDMVDFATRVTLAIAGWSFFGLDVSERIDSSSEALFEAVEIIQQRSNNPYLPPLWVPTPGNQRLKRALGRLDRHMDAIIDAAATQPDGEENYVKLLLAARDPDTGEGLDRRAIRDEVLSFYFAGHDTTSLTLSWALCFLVKHPEILSAVSEEVDAVLGTEAPNHENIKGLVLMRQVIDETLRLRPPAWSSARNCLEDDVINGIQIRKGDWVLPCQYLIHRHPGFWQHPERFDPTRFGKEQRAGRPKTAYFPFSMGPRTCIGSYFALVEAPVVLARLLQRVRVESLFSYEVKPMVHLLVRPDRPIPLRLTARDPA